MDDVKRAILVALMNVAVETVFEKSGAVVITTAQLHSFKPEPRFCGGSNPACSVSEIRDGEDY